MTWTSSDGVGADEQSGVEKPEQRLSIAFASNATGTPGDVLTPSELLADAL